MKSHHEFVNFRALGGKRCESLVSSSLEVVCEPWSCSHVTVAALVADGWRILPWLLRGGGPPYSVNQNTTKNTRRHIY